jgi:signal recognition particle receptor subunit beta
MAVAQNELEQLLQHNDVEHRLIPILVCANKQDLNGAMSPAEIVEVLGLSSIEGRPWQVQPTNALTGEGIQDAVNWIASSISDAATATYIKSRQSPS